MNGRTRTTLFRSCFPLMVLVVSLTSARAQAPGDYYGPGDSQPQPQQQTFAPPSYVPPTPYVVAPAQQHDSVMNHRFGVGLSVGHFSRAFRISTGLPPHQWLLRQRVKVAKQLMTVRDLPLSEIAISAGFANQSHFTRVFSASVGVSPAAWRSETQGAPESET